MGISEIYFNPRAKKGVAYESFCFEPENEEEKKLGSLFIVAELKDHFKKSYQIINELASFLKQEYYGREEKSAEKDFKELIKKANDFLIEKSTEQEIDWLENINLAVLSLVPLSNQEEWQINLSKKGSLDIIISREQEIVEIKENLALQKITSGQLINNDKIMILTEEVFDFLRKNNLLEKISEISDKKQLNSFFKPYKKSLQGISGIFLFIVLKPYLLKTKKLPALKIPLFKIPVLKLKMPSLKINLTSLKNIPQKIKSSVLNKKIFFVFALLLILFIGSLIFKTGKEREEENQKVEQSLEIIRDKISQAESFLIIKDEKKANQLLQEAWQEISALENQEELKEIIKEPLYALNKIEEIKEPALGADFDKNKFSEPITYRLNTYSLDAEQGKIIRNNKTWAESDLLINAKSIAVDGNIWVLDKENKILRFYLGKVQESFTLDFFPAVENAAKIFTNTSLSFIYILDPGQKRIILIDKKGELIKQIISEKFDSLQDIYVTEDPENIYLLNNNTVYQINL